MSFSPTGVAGLYAWYVADNIGTTNGNTVQWWMDAANNGVNAVPPTSSVAPTYITNAINGHAAVAFNSGNYLTVVGQPNYSFGTSNTTFVVFQTLHGSMKQAVYSVGSTSTSETYIGLNLDSSGQYFAQGISNTIVKSTGNIYQPYTWQLREDQTNSATSTTYLYETGTLITTGTLTYNLPSPNVLSIGRSQLGTFPTFFSGYIAEIIGYNNAISTTDATNVTNYLINKYALVPPASSSPVNFKLPPDLSGLVAWYRSTSIGISGVDGSAVQYWPDDSGSGNNLTISSASSGSWVFPTYYRNSINGYPVVRFINGQGYSYLQTDVNHTNLGLSQNNISLFGVFTPADSHTEQSVYGIDDGFNNTYYCVGLNRGTPNSFYSATGPRLGFNITIASSTTFGTNMYQAGSFTIRSDRFYPSTSSVLFGRYATELASGYNNTYSLTSPIFRLGYNSASTLAFYGDVAEIIAYNRSLNDYETELVNDYLINKYMPGNVGTISLFLYGDTPTGLYKPKTLYALGSEPYVNTSTTLYTGSSSLRISGIPLYEYSSASMNSGFPLYAIGSLQQWPPITLFLASNTNSTSGTPLYTASTAYSSHSTTLYTSGALGSLNSNIPLYIGASSIVSNNIPLYTITRNTNSLNTSLFMAGSLQSYPPISLYLLNIPSGSSLPKGTMDLYMSGLTPPSLSLYSPLYTNATTPGVNGLYNNTTLYLEGGKLYQSLPLYVGVDKAPYPPSGAMTLYVGDPFSTGTFVNNIPLVLYNNVSGINSLVKRLYIKGAGGINGGSIAYSNETPLYLYNNTSLAPVPPAPVQTNSYFYNQYTYPGYFQVDYFDTISLSGSVSNVQPISTNNNISLYMAGNSPVNSGVSLYEHGAAPNSGYINMYTIGRTLGFSGYTTAYIRGY